MAISSLKLWALAEAAAMKRMLGARRIDRILQFWSVDGSIVYTRGQGMIVPRLIERKREGGSIAADEWHELVRNYAAGKVPDYQMSALLMAIFFRGLDRGETNALTDAMIQSGGQLELGHLAAARIDKHSTGGVGDKVSLVLAPLIASLGVAVPMMSGRGLGHTGGTLDKLESIPGFRTDLTLSRAARQVESIGCALIGQTREIAPADRKLYALRDATATIEVIPLIAASIMSKKLAEGLTGLILDVKQGSGAFMADADRAQKLARAMIELGEDRGCPVVALTTAMDRPLGFACGNALEVRESIDALRGNGPDDLMDVTYALGAEMLILAGTTSDYSKAWSMMRDAISSGGALDKFRQIIEAQNGDPHILDSDILPSAPVRADFTASRDGLVLEIAPRAVGHGVIALGGGRRTMEDRIDPSVGFVITAKPGDSVIRGQPLATVHALDDAGAQDGVRALAKAIRIGDGAAEPLPLVSHRITSEGVTSWERPSV